MARFLVKYKSVTKEQPYGDTLFGTNDERTVRFWLDMSNEFHVWDSCTNIDIWLPDDVTYVLAKAPIAFPDRDILEDEKS
jgi:hypothetical protein